MKQHAFLVLAHKEPKLLARTLKILEKENHFFFVHVDAKTENFDEFISASSGINNVFFLKNRIKVYHAGISIVDAELEMINEAVSHPVSFDYYHLISGQDYPLRSNESFDEFFENTSESFVYIDDEELAMKLEPYYDRCANEFNFNNTSTFFAKAYKKFRIGKLLSLVYRRSKIENYSGGWQWFSWSEKTCRFILNYLEENSKFYQRFSHTGSPDEHIFITIIKNNLDKLSVKTHDPLRYISWHPHRLVETSYRPYTLNHLDFDSVMQSRAFFCRKVEEKESAKLLDMIDEQRNNPYDIEQYSNFV